jgi:hypothetical protein
MKRILAVGCSMTKGHGLAKESQDPKLWVNRIFESIGSVHNLSITGRNNQWIFHETMSALLRERGTHMISCWLDGVPYRDIVSM